MVDNEQIEGLTLDIAAVQQEKLRSIFPQCFVEGKLDERKLFALLGKFDTYDVNDRERYEFRWKGKHECLQLAGKRSAGTLRPCPEDSVSWENTRNVYIEGDNLEVLKLLQTAYYRKVKMIYIDPPYNTGNDFVYPDDFADPLARYREVTGQTTKSNPESMGRFHTNWLNMMYPRLQLASNLLRDDGVIFLSIDDNEVGNLKKLCNEVFGEENFRNIIATRRYDKNLNRQFMNDGLVTLNVGLEFILVYSKSIDFKFTPVFRVASEERATQGYWKGFWNNADRPTMRYDCLGVTPESGQWKWKKELAEEAVSSYAEYTRDHSDISLEDYWLQTGKDKKFIRRNPNGKGMNHGVEHWVPPANGILRTSNWSDFLASKPTGVDTPFDSPKNIEVVMELIRLSGAEEDDLILDFFSGSATTAHAVMQLNAEDGGNRRFILVQLPEMTNEKSEAYKAGYKNICEIGKERIRRAGAKIKADSPLGTEDLDTGFRVFKLDSSNLKFWDNSPITGENALAELEARLKGMLDILKPDRSDYDVVYEVMLKLGQDLCEPVAEIDLPDGRKAYGVGADKTTIVCLAQNVTIDDAQIMAEYEPKRIVFADACFKNSTDKSNVKLCLREKDISIRVL